MNTMSLLKPPAVDLGAAFSVIAPASSAQAERSERGFAALRNLGYAPAWGANTLQRGPLYFAGTAAQRLADLHAAFTDKNSSAVISLRGGYGSNYLLDNVNFETIAAHPKPFFAYSDLTGLQLRLLDEIGLPVFHGPMLAADFYLDDGVHLKSFQSAICGQPYSLGPAEGLRVLKPAATPGPVSGTLYGGCLSILVSLLGTPWEPCTEGTLLFLEDVGVKPYQIDRMLWQLHVAGKLDGEQQSHGVVIPFADLPIGRTSSRLGCGRGITCTAINSPTRRAAAAPASVAARTAATSPRTRTVT